MMVPALSRREPAPPRLAPMPMELVALRSMLALAVLVSAALLVSARTPAPLMVMMPLLVQALP